MPRNERHPLHEVLVPHLNDWAPLFARWEVLVNQMRILEEHAKREIMVGGRSRRLGEIYRRLAILRAEISETQPLDRYLMSGARVIADVWGELIGHWRRLQGLSIATIGPDGGRLVESQKVTWEKLIKGKEESGEDFGK